MLEITNEFKYEALTSEAKEVSGTLAAKNNSDAIKQIRNMELFPTKVREVNPPKKYDSYLEYLSELLGDKFISLGKRLKGEK